MPYYHRLIEHNLLKFLKIFPVVGLTGPRQSGKSTLLKHQLGNLYRYVTFDNQSIVDAFYADPDQFMGQYSDRVIFDEVQKVPELFNYIKIAVDNDRQNYGKYILTGSSQFSFIHQINESLAGRMGLLTLLPFQYLEIPDYLRDQAIYSGSYPELIDRDYAFKEEWYASYLTTYLEKDVRTLGQVGDLRDFSRFINLLAANVSQTLNLTHYARDIGVSVTTIKRWLSVLEASYIIFLLPPYYKNIGKRIIKSPKLYFFDTGLVAYLTRIHSKELYENGPMAGALFENYLITEIYKRELLDSKHKELCYYRTSHGEEIDLIIDRLQSKELIEIKSGHTFKPAMLKQMKILLEKNDAGYLLYNGKAFPFDPHIKVINYHDYLSRK
jgi:predicted AAA+ superfamily ATPase